MKLSDLDHDINMEFLTKDEKEVLELSWKGKQIVEISSRLHLSTRTVNRRIASIKRKIGGVYMSSKDKEYTWRREGMIYAFNRIKDSGLEEFEKEIKRRGLLKICIDVSNEDILEAYRKMADNMMNNMLPLFYSQLVDNFDFEKEQLIKLHKGFVDEFNNVLTLDWLGEHYVSISDYQKEMNEKYGFDFDMTIAQQCQSEADEEANHFHYVKLEKLIEMLEKDGYPAAALYVKKKIEDK